jgi:hypothetical protein
MSPLVAGAPGVIGDVFVHETAVAEATLVPTGLASPISAKAETRHASRPGRVRHHLPTDIAVIFAPPPPGVT